MKISISNRQKDLPLPPKKAICSLVTAILKYEGCTTDEVGLFFVSNKEMCALHEQFFHDPSPTDCMAFPMDTSYLGDIFICPYTAITYAKKKKLDPYKEVTLYIVHAILHLLGYDDLDPSKRKKMRQKERIHMKQLEKAELVLQTQLATYLPAQG